MKGDVKRRITQGIPTYFMSRRSPTLTFFSAIQSAPVSLSWEAGDPGVGFLLVVLEESLTMEGDDDGDGGVDSSSAKVELRIPDPSVHDWNWAKCSVEDSLIPVEKGELRHYHLYSHVREEEDHEWLTWPPPCPRCFWGTCSNKLWGSTLEVPCG